MEKNSFDQEIINCLEYLRTGKLACFPTDTGWVLACDASIDLAVNHLKEGDPSKMITILLADERDLLKYVSSLNLEVFNFLDQQEGPTAIYFEGLLGISDEVLNNEHRAPFRIVKEDFSRHLLKRFRKPVAVIPIAPGFISGSVYQVKDLSKPVECYEQQLVIWSPGSSTILQP